MEKKRNPKVSVCCVCYNHEKFLIETLNGIFSQKTNFDYEVIIYDDASTDDSIQVIEDFKKCNNFEINTLYSNVNNYSQGLRPFSQIFPLVKGRFIALCEGDDYWIDENKLQKQFDELTLREDIDVCFHPALTLNSSGLSNLSYGYHGDELKVIDVSDVIRVSGGFMPMASMFIRTKKIVEIMEKEPHFCNFLLRHSAIQILCSDKHGALYLPMFSSVYRSMHDGSWSAMQGQSIKVKIKSFIEFFKRNKELNRITNYRYSTYFKKVFIRRLIGLAKNIIN